MQKDTINEIIAAFWQTQLQKEINTQHDFKKFVLPLARIKKVMKSDPDIKLMMISQDTPVLFSKACELFILELTLRAWLETEDSKRRTVQRSDVVQAIQKNDMYDFLIDIVPREEKKDPNYMNPLMLNEQLMELQAANPMFAFPMNQETMENE